MHHITTPDKTTLYLKDWGSGPPVILLHGWPLTADSWDDQAVVLAGSGFRVLAYDRRGFGRSSQPWGGYDYDNLADDLACVIQQTGVENATLVGFSMGGGEVARYMSRHGGKGIAKAALIASIVPGVLQSDDNPHGAPQSAFDERDEQLRIDRAHYFQGFFKKFFGVDLLSHPVSDAVLDWAQTQALQASLRATQECAHSIATTDFRADLAHFNVPTLIVHGTADANVPIAAAAQRAHAAIAPSTLITYDGAPHGLFATHKERLSRDLLEFVRR